MSSSSQPSLRGSLEASQGAISAVIKQGQVHLSQPFSERSLKIWGHSIKATLDAVFVSDDYTESSSFRGVTAFEYLSNGGIWYEHLCEHQVKEASAYLEIVLKTIPLLVPPTAPVVNSAASPPSVVVDQRDGERPIWEYETVIGSDPQTAPRDEGYRDMEEALAMGSQGWELVSVVALVRSHRRHSDGLDHSFTVAYRFFFKREVRRA